MSEDQQFYVGQKAVIAKDGAVLVLRTEEFGSDLPGGKIKEGEYDFIKELKREIAEETTLEVSVGNVFASGYIEIPKTSKNRNAGRKIYVVCYACRYISGEVSISDEHETYSWVTKDTFMEKVDHPLVREFLAKYFALFPETYIQKQKAKKSTSLLSADEM